MRHVRYPSTSEFMAVSSTQDSLVAPGASTYSGVLGGAGCSCTSWLTKSVLPGMAFGGAGGAGGGTTGAGGGLRCLRASSSACIARSLASTASWDGDGTGSEGGGGGGTSAFTSGFS